jgi:hypothetical protein
MFNPPAGRERQYFIQAYAELLLDKYAFCPVYKTESKFSKRIIEDVESDISRTKKIDTLLAERLFRLIHHHHILSPILKRLDHLEKFSNFKRDKWVDLFFEGVLVNDHRESFFLNICMKQKV